MVEFFKTVGEWCLGRGDIMSDYVIHGEIPEEATGQVIIGKRQLSIRSQLPLNQLWL